MHLASEDVSFGTRRRDHTLLDHTLDALLLYKLGLARNGKMMMTHQTNRAPAEGNDY